MPRRGIRVAPACLPKIKQALRRHGFPSQRALAETLGLSRTTITSFFNGKAIDYTNFVEISERLGLDWQAIAYIEEETSPPAPLLQGEGSHALGLTSPPTPFLQAEGSNLAPVPPFPRREGGLGGLGLDWRQISQEMLYSQNQQRLTTNPLTTGDGLTFELDEIYVPLGLVERKQRERRIGDISPEEGSRIYESETSDEITQTFQNNEFFEQILRPGKSKRIAIIGEPGAGKTTMLQKIAAWVLDHTSDLPIWISLADLQGKTIEEYLLSNWLKSATRKVRVTPEMEEALGELFNSGRVWLLLDGVDEMVTEPGNALAQISKQLTGWVSDARIVLTCRLNVWDAGKNALENFETYRNLDFSYGDAQTPDQVGQFIRCWFKHNPALAERLRTELDKSGRERIKDAVKNPLRLALLCRTWALGKGGLPNTKAGLYRQFVEALYEWKQEQFSTSSTQRQELNQALGELAKRAIAEEKTKFRLRHRLVCEILGEPDAKLFKLALQLGWLNQVGVAAEAESCGEKVYAFYHPTFQEYFAAQAVEDWHYFLNYNPANPRQGTYRIFESQWKEVILLWLGREDVLKEQKEEFIRALVGFYDQCGFRNFYGHRAEFLAAAGIAEFVDCSYSDQILGQIIKRGFGYLNIEKQAWKKFIESGAERARSALQETDQRKAIAALLQLIELTPDESTRRLAAEVLGKIDPKNQTAIAELIRLIKSSHNDDIRREAVWSLGEIGKENLTAIALLLQLIQSNDEYNCWIAVDSLGKIGKDDSTVIAALVRLIELNQNEFTRKIAAESLGKVVTDNPTAIATLARLIESNEDEFTRRIASESLGKISRGHHLAIATLLQIISSSPDQSNRWLAAYSLKEIGFENKDAIVALEQLISLTQSEHIRQEMAASLGKINPGNKTAMTALVEILLSTYDEYIRRQTTFRLREIGTNDPYVIAALEQVISSNQDKTTRRIAAYNLGKIDPDNQTAIAALVELLSSNEDESIRWHAAENLGKIAPGNPIAIATLVEIISSTQDESTCLQAVEILEEIGTGNPTAIAALVKIIASTENMPICRQVADSLKQMLRDDQLAEIVKTFKHYLSHENYENYFGRFEACYKLIWHCAQNMSYPDFYQAWHNSTVAN